jgi:hypothetical protein
MKQNKSTNAKTVLMPEKIPEKFFGKKLIALPPSQQAAVLRKLGMATELRKKATALSERLEELMQKDFEGNQQIQKLARTLRLMRIKRNQLTQQYAELMGLANALLFLPSLPLKLYF